MRFLNWSHAIIGFLIGVALVIYVRSDSDSDVQVQSSAKVVEVQTE